MATTKTTWTNKSVTAFINAVPDPVKRADSFQLIGIMQKLSGNEPEMWGPTIVGFGKYHYKYESGHEGDAPMISFSPRKPAIVLYIASQEESLKKLGKHKMGKYCIYIKKLADIHIPVLEKMISLSLRHTKITYK